MFHHHPFALLHSGADRLGQVVHLGEGHFKPDVQVVGVAVPKTPPIPV